MNSNEPSLSADYWFMVTVWKWSLAVTSKSIVFRILSSIVALSLVAIVGCGGQFFSRMEFFYLVVCASGPDKGTD
jgi:hypothetical protein